MITNSEGSKQDLVDNFGIDEKKIQVIVNAYDIEKIDALKMIPIEDPAIEALFSKYKIILSVGRFSVEKGLAQALKIFKEIRKADPSVKYVLVGQGGEKSRLSSIARQLSLSVYDKETDSEPLLDDYDVLFLGFKNNPYQYCYRARLFLFPPFLRECRLGRSFHLWRQCVASDCKSGPREVLSNTSHDRGLTYPYFELGYLMPVLNESSPGSLLSADEKNWVEVIKEVLENKGPFPSDTAFRKKREQFDKENVVKKWEKILDMPG
ncbi:MAG: glycosyltransferase [Chitinophagaceae bacterium]|nr:glycosyltransferase [Chitinophagaceae bacterium]